MKTRRPVPCGIVLVILCGLLVSSCVSPPGDRTRVGLVTVEGQLKPAGMTSFMYGSHLLYDRSGRLTHALTSETLNLKKYEGDRVRVEGKPVEGYPVDNGPPYLRVKTIETLNRN